jgi:uncharacterized protein YdhG (YjbR/CyaY superfamily)
MTIHEAAPEAQEKISYQMPTFFLKGNLVHFAAFKEHIGFYPVPTGIEKFKKELSVYKQGKGSEQFPLDQPMPYDLITKIVKFRVKENLAAAAAKWRMFLNGRSAAKRAILRVFRHGRLTWRWTGRRAR